MSSAGRRISQVEKVAFIERHKSLVKRATADANELEKQDKHIKESNYVVELLNQARLELGYSARTYDKDIYYTLLRAYTGLVIKEFGLYTSGLIK